MSVPLIPTTINLLTEEVGSRTGTIRVAGLMGYSDLVTELGGNPNRLFKRCGLDPQIFNNNENVIPFNLAARLFSVAAEETRCPHFGLLLGQHRKPISVLGPIGFLMRNSPTVGAALRSVLRYMHLQVVGVTSKLLVQRAKAFLTATIDHSSSADDDQVLDLIIADMFTLTRILGGRGWLPSAVYSARRTPADIAPYRTLFRVPVYFNQGITGLSFSANWLESPVSDADPDLCSLMQSYVAQIEQQYSDDFLEQTRRVMRTMLPTGKCNADRFADLFSMNRSTLHRRLTAEGTTFGAMVDEMRHEIATSNLAETSMPISQLAAILGYRGISAFTRAFRRWTGVAPTAWRERHRSLIS